MTILRQNSKMWRVRQYHNSYHNHTNLYIIVGDKTYNAIIGCGASCTVLPAVPSGSLVISRLVGPVIKQKVKSPLIVRQRCAKQ